jgi:hypothetical protein
MKKAFQFLTIALLVIGSQACKNSKKATSESVKIEDAKEAAAPVKEAKPVKENAEPVVQENEGPSRPVPRYADSLFFRIDRTPCFGQCPTYTVNIYQSGHAQMEGKKFFDYEGFFATKFSEDELIRIEKMAIESGYAKMNHVYDAPVTDLPSTTTILQTEQIHQWVYNRMNAPDELRKFEREMETIIKDKQWSPRKKGQSEGKSKGGDQPE